MNVWEFLSQHPVWGLVYLVLVLLGLNGISVGLGAGFKPDRIEKKDKDDEPAGD